MSKNSIDTPVSAILPNGKQVHHGMIRYNVFTRRINSSAIRFSDKSFCINKTVVPTLKNRKCKTLEFVWVFKHKKMVYRIDFDFALDNFKMVTNEYGEVNLRIPIDQCILINEFATSKIGSNQPKHIVIENELKGAKQPSLF
jgi:hypothetical protein